MTDTTPAAEAEKPLSTEVTRLTPATRTLPPEVDRIIAAVRAFSSATEDVGVQQFSEATSGLSKPELAWVLDRLDDVRDNLASLLDALTHHVVTNGADGDSYCDAVRNLRDAAHGVSTTTQTLDPKDDRYWLLHRDQQDGPEGTDTDKP